MLGCLEVRRGVDENLEGAGTVCLKNRLTEIWIIGSPWLVDQNVRGGLGMARLLNRDREGLRYDQHR